jgi:hypothetical protein
MVRALFMVFTLERVMRTVLVVLQNAYDKGSLSDGWSYKAWRDEFWRSRSGVRLRPILASSALLVRVCNTTPKIGTGPDSRLPADRRHLSRVLRRVRPDYVVACGAQAKKSLATAWRGNLVCIPHPAFRLLTNALVQDVARFLCTHSFRPLTRVEFVQKRGRHEIVEGVGDAA